MVEGVPIGLTNDYDDFRTRRDREFRLRNFVFDRKYLKNYWASDLGDNGLKAYIACLKGSSGLQVWIEPGTAKKDEVAINVRWSVPNYAGKQKLIASFGGIASGERDVVVEKLINGGEIILKVKRDRTKDFSATFNVDNAYSGYVGIPKPPRMVKYVHKDTLEISGTITNPSTTSVKFEQHCLEVPKFPSGWKFVQNSWRIHPPLGPGIPRHFGSAHPVINPGLTTVCYQIWVSRYPNEDPSVQWKIWADAEVEVDRFDTQASSLPLQDAFHVIEDAH